MGKHVISLVNKLSKREKFYFSNLYSDSKSKNFVRLYSFISENPDCTIDEIKKHFKNTALERNLPSELNLLNKRILRALNIYQINLKNDEFNLQQAVQNARILLDKEERTQARKILAKAKKLAEENEEYSSLVKLISMQEEMDVITLNNKIMVQSSAFEIERRNCLDKIDNYFAFQKLYHQFVAIQYQEGLAINNPEDFPQLFNNKLLESTKNIKSKRAHELYLTCMNFRHFLLGEFKKSIPYSRKRIDFLSENPNIFGKKIISKAINNHVLSLLNAREFEEAKVYINRLENLEVELGEQNLILYFKNYLTTVFLVKTRNKSALEPFLEQSLSTIVSISSDINVTQRDQWFFCLFIGFFHTQDYSRTLDIYSTWLQFRIQDHNFLHTKLLRCICLYETKENQLLESEIENMNKLDKKSRHNFQFISYFYKFFLKYLKNEDSNTIFSDLSKQLLSLRANHKENQIMERLDVFYWLETTRIHTN